MSQHTAIPNAVVRDSSLSPGTRILFGVIISYAWGTNPCKVSAKQLAEEAGIALSTFWASIKTLRERGLLNVDQVEIRGVMVNQYRPVTSPVQVTDSDPSENRTGPSGNQTDPSAHRSDPVRSSDTEEDKGKKTKGRSVVAAGASPVTSDVVGALIAAGFDDLTIENYRTAISLVVANYPPDTDWFALGNQIEAGKRSGAIKSKTPDGALKYMAQAGVPRIGMPAKADRPLFGDRPLTADQRRHKRTRARIAAEGVHHGR